MKDSAFSQDCTVRDGLKYIIKHGKNETIISTIESPDNCLKCKSSDKCEKCEDGFIFIDGKCVEQCPANQFFNGTDCEGCAKNCKYCNSTGHC